MTVNREAFLNSNLSTEERVSALLSQMTLDEKIAQLGSYWSYELLDGATLSPEKAQTLLAHGIGHITRVGGASNLTPEESARVSNAIQRYLVESTRLGIPAVIHEECCSGYMARGATVFPQAIGVASTWEPELVEAMASVIREQLRAVGAHHALAPVLDVARDARWGRVEETFGEDPYLVSCLGTAYVRGLQGADLVTGIAATGKHFVGYGASEGGLNWAPAHIGRRELLEVYLHPFEAAIREANMASIMHAYHELDGIPCAASRELLTDILRDTWGFTGTVVSDYFAVNMLAEYHRVSGDKAEAALLALQAGLDVELPRTDCYGEPLKEAVRSGRVPMSLIDRAVSRVLAQKFALGLFEKPYVDESGIVFDTEEQRRLARVIAQKSIVLLKNQDNVLPLPKDIDSIAVIGPNADTVRNLFGDYSYPAHIETLLEMTEQTNVFGVPRASHIRKIDDFIPAKTILQAIRDKVAPHTQVRYARGCDIRDESPAGFADAVEAARNASVAVLVMGDKAGLTDDCTSGEARDRAALDLPGVQEALVHAVYETGTPTILVLVNGRPVTLNWMADSLSAIVEAWFPAEEGAQAIADVLFGDVNPGGKLPMSFPAAVGQVPTYYGHRVSGGRSHWKGDYVETSARPLYPFGYGLSYTTFTLSNLRIQPEEVAAGDDVIVQIDVTNTGQRAGDEVVQLYTHQRPLGITRPVKELRGFKRITLEAGERKTATFTMNVNQLAFYGRQMDYAVEPGEVEVIVGNSSQDEQARGTFRIVGPRSAVRHKVFFSSVTVR